MPFDLLLNSTTRSTYNTSTTQLHHYLHRKLHANYARTKRERLLQEVPLKLNVGRAILVLIILSDEIELQNILQHLAGPQRPCHYATHRPEINKLFPTYHSSSTHSLYTGPKPYSLPFTPTRLTRSLYHIQFQSITRHPIVTFNPSHVLRFYFT